MWSDLVSLFSSLAFVPLDNLFPPGNKMAIAALNLTSQILVHVKKCLLSSRKLSTALFPILWLGLGILELSLSPKVCDYTRVRVTCYLWSVFLLQMGFEFTVSLPWGRKQRRVVCLPFLLLLFSRSVVSSGLQHARLSCPSPSLGACWNSCPLSWLCHPTISSSVVSFSSCLQSFPASGSFPMQISFPHWFKPLHTLYSRKALLRCAEGVSNHSSGSLVAESAGGWGLSCITTLGLMGRVRDSTFDSHWCPLPSQFRCLHLSFICYLPLFLSPCLFW